MSRYIFLSIWILVNQTFCTATFAEKGKAHNPIMFADVPDISIIRVGNNYYMSSTTMHMSPGIPIMKSTDLINWKIVNYVYDVLDTIAPLSLNNGQNAYGKGSWASSIRYHKGKYYVSTFSQTTGKTYVYVTQDIEKGPWKKHSFIPSLHDHTLFFDDDGHTYMIYGSGKLKLIELNTNASGIKPGTQEQTIIENASLPAGPNIALPAEGSQLFKINGKYYLFNITWPQNGMRTVIVNRADKITGPYEGKILLQDKGVAQGGLIDTPDGKWYAYLFQDHGAIGRTPYLVPVKWTDGWPLLGINGKVPEKFNLPANKSLIPGIVTPDEFNREKGEAPLVLAWQWNHNPDNKLWSITARKGYLRLKTGRIDSSFLAARNTLTQRTIGPVCSASTSLDISHMHNGDFAGLSLLQKNFGLVGVKCHNSNKSIVMINAQSGKPIEMQKIPLNQDTIYLKIICNFKSQNDLANFFYSLNGTSWIKIGSSLKMTYTIPHFMGYRFGLFNYATQSPGGFVDFDFFHIKDYAED